MCASSAELRALDWWVLSGNPGAIGVGRGLLGGEQRDMQLGSRKTGDRMVHVELAINIL